MPSPGSRCSLGALMSERALESVLVTVLDTLIPPRDGVFGAGGLGLSEAVFIDAQDTGKTQSIERILMQVPSGFAELSAADREAILHLLEQEEPMAFWAILNMAYTAYYTHPDVLAGISERTGYNPGPPQPLGYAMLAFHDDDVLLDPVRRMDPSWRPDN